MMQRPRNNRRLRRLSDGQEQDGGSGAASPVRRCVATGARAARDLLIRHVVAPDGMLVPDLAGKLPGRGLWLTATREAAALAVRRNAFSRNAGAAVSVPADLPDRLEAALAVRAVEGIGLARRAGLAVAGFVKVETALRQGRVAIRLEAGDGSADGRGRLGQASPAMPVLTALTARELAQAFDRSHVVHAAICERPGEAGPTGGLAGRIVRDFARLAGFRPQFAGHGLESAAMRCIEGTVKLSGRGCSGQNDDHG